MNDSHELTGFFSLIVDDCRIGSSHISVYMALYYFYMLNGHQNPIGINREGVMRIAKISGIATYHKCIRGLVEYGYIQYMPSFNPRFPSQVILLNWDIGDD